MPNNNNTTPLGSVEYRRVGEMIYDKVRVYENLPAGIEVDYQGLKGINHLGFMTTPGGKITKRFITGGFAAQLPFQLLYKTTPTTNSTNFNAENFVDDLADWLEQRPYPELSDGRVVTSIVMDSITYISTADNDGSVVFVRNGSVFYEKEG